MESPPNRFERMNELPLYWLNHAEELRAAAGAIWVAAEDWDTLGLSDRLGLPPGARLYGRLPGPYQMLTGLALELLFKAIVVAKHGELEHHHKLDQLSRQAAIAYSPEQVGLLRVLASSIEWAGRYPVPKRPEALGKRNRDVSKHLFDHVPFGDSGLHIGSPNKALSWDSFIELWDIAFLEYSKHHRLHR